MFYFWILFYLVFMFSCIYFYKNVFYNLMVEFDVLNLGEVDYSFVLLFDESSLFFGLVVMFISMMVMIYSYFYIGVDYLFSLRFLIVLFMFVLSMLLVIYCPMLLSMMLGWDGLGLVSFCLVIFYGNYMSLKSGMVTIYMNRVGDVMFLLLIMMMWGNSVWDVKLFYFNDMIVFYLLMVLGGMTKSAQVPFSVWLPAAMAAPTPVSSLVHSSTLVTAGLYLLIRHWDYMVISVVSVVIFMFMILTLLLAGIAAVMEMDMSKVIAMSTLSQLGLMTSLLYLGEVDLSYIHMINHAFFKALLFLSCGVFIVFGWGGQDSRYLMFSFYSYFMVMMCFFLSNLSLMGFSFSSGFYSKDYMLESVCGDYMYLDGLFVYFGCFMTVFYGVRLIMMGFGYLMSKVVLMNVDFEFKLLFVMMFMGIFMILVGWFNYWGFFIMEWWNVSVLIKVLEFFMFFISVLFFMIWWKILYSWFFMDYIFFKWITVSGLSFMLLLMNLFVKIDYLWNEVMGVMGFNLLLKYFDYLYGYFYNYLKVLMGVFIFFMFLLIYI